MGFFDKIGSAIGSVALAPVNGLINAVGGGEHGNEILSGIPFLGEGFAARQNRDFQAAQTAQQMDFQERMANTVHQREVADLQAAGLNPMLSGMGGSGAPSPSGASASGSMGSGAASSASFLKSLVNNESQEAKERIKTAQQTRLNQSFQNLNTKEDTKLKEAQIEVQKEQKKVAAASAKSIAEDAEIKRYNKEGAKVRSNYEKEWGDIDLKTNRLLDTVGKGINSASDIIHSVNPLRNVLKGPQTGTRTERYDKQGELIDTTTKEGMW